jgi:two-component system NtrC family sensor kinase
MDILAATHVVGIDQQQAPGWVRRMADRMPRRMPRHPGGQARSEHVWASGLIVAAVVVPALLFAVVAWLDRAAVLRQAMQNSRYVAGIYAEHARNVFQTHRLVARMVDEHIRGMTWPEIADSAELNRYLAEIVQDYPQVQSLWLADVDGKVRNSSAVFPVHGLSVADRDYFLALRRHDSGLYISHPIQGKVFTGNIIVNVAQRRSSSDGAFDGVIVVSALPTYFTDFWKTVAPGPADMSALYQRDGAVLGRLPRVGDTMPSLDASAPVMQAIAHGGDAGAFQSTSPIDGVERLVAFQKVPGFPVYAANGRAMAGVLGRWHNHLAIYGLFFLAATFALVLMAALAVQRSRRELVALVQLKEAAEHRAAAERQLRQAQKMDVLGQMAGGVAHDFRNVLNVISGNLALLGDRADPEEAGQLAMATEGVDLAATMVQSLLSFARKQPLHAETFDINDALRSMEGLLRNALGSSRYTLDMRLADEPCRVDADRNQTELAVLNLVLNARDAMPGRGTLTVTTARRRLAGEPAGLVGEFCSIAVADTGCGMPPDVAARAFEPFFTTKAEGKGTGLGLSMVWGFARQSGGAAAIDSAPGRGTAVTVFLPVDGADGQGISMS